MITRCEVDRLIDSCENNTERLVILSLVDLRLAALEICNMSVFDIRGKWLLVKDIRSNEKKCLFLSRNIDKLLFSLPPMPKDPREVREVVLRVAERAGIKATPTDLRRFSKTNRLFDEKGCWKNGYREHNFRYIPSREYKRKFFRHIEWDKIKIPEWKT